MDWTGKPYFNVMLYVSLGQPFPVENIKQSYSADQTEIDINWKHRRPRATYVIEYCPRFSHSNHTKSQFVRGVSRTKIRGLENVFYKIAVYEKVQDETLRMRRKMRKPAEKNHWSKVQANTVFLRPGFLGQPSTVEQLTQMNSINNQSITLRFKKLSDGQSGDSKVLGYKVKVYVNATFLTINDCHRDYDTHFMVYCFIDGLPQALPLDVYVYGYNSFDGGGHRDGDQSHLQVRVNQSIYTGKFCFNSK